MRRLMVAMTLCMLPNLYSLLLQVGRSHLSRPKLKAPLLPKQLQIAAPCNAE